MGIKAFFSDFRDFFKQKFTFYLITFKYINQNAIFSFIPCNHMISIDVQNINKILQLVFELICLPFVEKVYFV